MNVCMYVCTVKGDACGSSVVCMYVCMYSEG